MLLNQMMLLGLGRGDRTTIEMSHAFARMGEASGGVAVHLLDAFLSPRSEEARAAARRALMHLGPSATADVLDLLASSGWVTSRRGRLEKAPSTEWSEDVMQYARTFLQAVSAATAPPVAASTDGSRSHDSSPETPEVEELFHWKGQDDETRAARHEAAIWLLREAVPPTRR
jgi:hypothetical protein